MAFPKSNESADIQLEWWYQDRGITLVQPTNLWMRLYDIPPGDDLTTEPGQELSYAGYVPVSVGIGPTNWVRTSPRRRMNANEIAFAGNFSSAAVIVRAAALWSDATGGYLIVKNQYQGALVVQVGSRPIISAGTFQHSEN